MSHLALMPIGVGCASCHHLYQELGQLKRRIAEMDEPGTTHFMIGDGYACGPAANGTKGTFILNHVTCIQCLGRTAPAMTVARITHPGDGPGNKPPKIQGHPGYLALLDEMRALHIKKAKDYGTDGDPLKNIRGSLDIGIEPDRGAWLRALDKVRRINRHYSGHELANESLEDSLTDLAAYCLIALALRRERAAGGAGQVEQK